MPNHPSLAKYNKKRHEVIVGAILAGNSRTTAFRLAGLHPDSAFAWLKQGRDHPDQHPEYVSLQADIEHAEALVESEKVAQVKAAADNGTWQAAAWWLERRKPQDWGKDREVAAVAEVSRPQVNILILEDPNAREASRELLRGLAGLGTGRADVALGPGTVRQPPQDIEG